MSASNLHTKITRNLAFIVGVLLLLAGITSILEWREVSLFAGLILSVVFLLLVVWINHEFKTPQPWSNLAIGFGVIYVSFTSFNYAFTLSFIGRSIPIPELMEISQTDSIFLVIEMLGYFFMGLSTLAIIPVFGFSKQEKAIKGLFALNGFLGVGGLFGYIIDLPMSIMYWGLLLWNLILPLACFLVSRHFHQQVHH